MPRARRVRRPSRAGSDESSDSQYGDGESESDSDEDDVWKPDESILATMCRDGRARLISAGRVAVAYVEGGAYDLTRERDAYDVTGKIFNRSRNEINWDESRVVDWFHAANLVCELPKTREEIATLTKSLRSLRISWIPMGMPYLVVAGESIVVPFGGEFKPVSDLKEDWRVASFY